MKTKVKLPVLVIKWILKGLQMILAIAVAAYVLFSRRLFGHFPLRKVSHDGLLA